MIDIMKGNLVDIAKKGKFDVIIHFCNCQCEFEGDLSINIGKAFPESIEVDKNTEIGNHNKLGSFSEAKSGDLTIVNMYSQFFSGNVDYNIDYKATKTALRSIAKKHKDKRIGIAKLDFEKWKTILNIICHKMADTDTCVIV